MKPEPEEKETKAQPSFGETSLGEGIGCGFMILCIGAAIALIIFAMNFASK